MRCARNQPTVLIVPGLRGHVAQHWQTLLHTRLKRQGRKVRSVAPMGRANLDCETRVAAIERVAGLAHDWGSRLVDLGEVGHLNPDSGFGNWHSAENYIDHIALAA